MWCPDKSIVNKGTIGVTLTIVKQNSSSGTLTLWTLRIFLFCFLQEEKVKISSSVGVLLFGVALSVSGPSILEWTSMCLVCSFSCELKCFSLLVLRVVLFSKCSVLRSLPNWDESVFFFFFLSSPAARNFSTPAATIRLHQSSSGQLILPDFPRRGM